MGFRKRGDFYDLMTCFQWGHTLKNLIESRGLGAWMGFNVSKVPLIFIAWVRKKLNGKGRRESEREKEKERFP